MKFGLPEETIHLINKIFAQFPEVEEALIYGSRAKNSNREGSDIDITLKGEKLTEEIRSQIWLDIDSLNTPYLIDLSIFQTINSKTLIEHINRNGKRFYIR